MCFIENYNCGGCEDRWREWVATVDEATWPLVALMLSNIYLWPMLQQPVASAWLIWPLCVTCLFMTKNYFLGLDHAVRTAVTIVTTIHVQQFKQCLWIEVFSYLCLRRIPRLAGEPLGPAPSLSSFSGDRNSLRKAAATFSLDRDVILHLSNYTFNDALNSTKQFIQLSQNVCLFYIRTSSARLCDMSRKRQIIVRISYAEYAGGNRSSVLHVLHQSWHLASGAARVRDVGRPAHTCGVSAPMKSKLGTQEEVGYRTLADAWSGRECVTVRRRMSRTTGRPTLRTQSERTYSELAVALAAPLALDTHCRTTTLSNWWSLIQLPHLAIPQKLVITLLTVKGENKLTSERFVR